MKSKTTEKSNNFAVFASLKQSYIIWCYFVILGHSKPELVENSNHDSPPTSKLVSKLFPSLKPAQNKQDEQVCIQTV